MTETPLIEGRGRRIACGDAVIELVWLGEILAVALAGGSVRFAGPTSDKSLAAHGRAILAACAHPDLRSIVTGGDDGRVRRITHDGSVTDLGQFGRTWVHALTSSPESSAIVAAVGREAIVWSGGVSKASHRFAFDSTIGGLALDARGKRLAVSHYGGASVLYPLVAQSGRVRLRWSGSHLACALAPDAGYVVTAMQETGLHGWKLPAKTQLSMTGYPSKTRSFSWSRRGRWLATSGSANAIVWPFTGKTGPMEKEPRVLGGRANTTVTRVAFHPTSDHLAIGHSDGAVSLVRLEDEAGILVDGAGASITALRWSGEGHQLAYGDEDGRVGIFGNRATA